MTSPISLWSLKKLPFDQMVHYIHGNSSPDFQARMTGMNLIAYELLDKEAAQERLASAISSMREEAYDNFLLELIDE